MHRHWRLPSPAVCLGLWWLLQADPDGHCQNMSRQNRKLLIQQYFCYVFEVEWGLPAPAFSQSGDAIWLFPPVAHSTEWVHGPKTALGWSTRDIHIQLSLFCCKVFLRKSHRSMESITSPGIRDQLKLMWRDTAGQQSGLLAKEALEWILDRFLTNRFENFLLLSSHPAPWEHSEALGGIAWCLLLSLAIRAPGSCIPFRHLTKDHFTPANCVFSCSKPASQPQYPSSKLT